MERYKSDSFRKYRRSSRDHTVVLPQAVRTRLHGIFRDVEKEFESLYLENEQLREQLNALERGTQFDSNDQTSSYGASATASMTAGSGPNDRDTKDDHDAFDRNMLKSFTKNKAIKTRHKLKQHTSKIVSSFKAPPLVCNLSKEYKGHRDGIWEICVSKVGHPILGTASADKTARIWGIDSGRCLTVYTGHTGSVNSIAFHPTQDLVMTASGDGTAHVWQAAVLPESLGVLGGVSSEESAESSEEDGLMGGGVGHRGSVAPAQPQQQHSIRAPISTLAGHQGVVISCSWLNEDLAVTAGWDRVANLYNVETGALLQSLAGHDSELTHVACHPTQRLVATCSVDTTFRLWDFRETIHSVSVFQGHTEAVTCAVFSRSDQIISGSDDRSVKVWDLRNMRAPVTSIQTASAVNKLAVSVNGLIAIPQDNRHVVIHLTDGTKLSRLPRDATKSHHRMVTSVCWGPDVIGQVLPASSGQGASSTAATANSSSSSEWRSTRPNLFSAGFDRLAFGWNVKTASTNKDEASKTKDKSSKEKDAF